MSMLENMKKLNKMKKESNWENNLFAQEWKEELRHKREINRIKVEAVASFIATEKREIKL